MRIDNEHKRVYVRQSWLKDMMLCPERARFAIASPEFKTVNDSAAIGTAVHAGIERILTSGASRRDATLAALGKFRELQSAPTGVKVTNINPTEYDDHIIRLVKAFETDILPHVPAGGQSELQFEVPTGTSANGYEIWFEGTIDYLTKDGIWDWKTASRKYSQFEKQAQDIQASIYNYAGVKLGLVNPDSVFNFGVMIRLKSAYGQIVTIKRDSTHSDFVIQQALSAVNYVFAMTNNDKLFDKKWLINDQHYLCSSRWCPWWSLCKGAHISEPLNSAEEA